MPSDVCDAAVTCSLPYHPFSVLEQQRHTMGNMGILQLSP